MSQLHLLVLSLVFCCLVAVTTSFQMKMNFDINRAASTISRNKILTKVSSYFAPSYNNVSKFQNRLQTLDY